MTPSRVRLANPALGRAVAPLSAQPELSAADRLTLARGQAALGEDEAARANAEQSLEEVPQVRAAPAVEGLPNRIGRGLTVVPQ